MRLFSEQTSNSKVALWHFICAFAIILMVWVGGITRLTDSGLSIVEWKPISGAIPPLNELDWQQEFAKYQTSPEYQKVNSKISLAEFKFIYWWEFGHRLLGRLIGFIFFLPLLYFYWAGQLAPSKLKTYFIILGLGALQAFFGWYMVKSGLAHDPHVSHFRLSLHFATAVIIYALIFLQGLDYSKIKNNYHFWPASLERLVAISIFSIFLQMILGAMVAGLDAGLIHNSFPSMSGAYLPPKETLKNWHSNPEFIQWLHRAFAVVVLIFTTFLSKKIIELKCKEHYFIGYLILFGMIGQAILGVLTILSQVDLLWASLHQIWIFIPFTALLYCYYQLKLRQIIAK